MAGFEGVVRPVIFPNIRPTPRQSLPPQDDPEQGFAVIRGQPAQAVDLTYSYSLSFSHSEPTEIERDVDTVRVYQRGGGGGDGAGVFAFGPATRAADDDVSTENYIDLQVARKIYVDAGPNGKQTWSFNPVEESDSVQVLQRNVRVTGS